MCVFCDTVKCYSLPQFQIYAYFMHIYIVYNILFVWNCCVMKLRHFLTVHGLICLVFSLWFEELIGLWQSCSNNPSWETVSWELEFVFSHIFVFFSYDCDFLADFYRTCCNFFYGLVSDHLNCHCIWARNPKCNVIVAFLKFCLQEFSVICSIGVHVMWCHRIFV